MKKMENGGDKMALTEKQRELDELKWNRSNELGADACGTFDYCAHCDKSLENPCDLAYSKLNVASEVKDVKKTVTKKTATKKSTAKKTTKKSTAKKSTAKKSTKKTTKK